PMGQLFTRVRPLVAVGALAMLSGFGAIALAWYHAGNTSQVWIQNQELVSGGIGGLALVVCGVAALLTDQVLRWRAEERDRFERLVPALTPAPVETPARSRRRSAA